MKVTKFTGLTAEEFRGSALGQLPEDGEDYNSLGLDIPPATSPLGDGVINNPPQSQGQNSGSQTSQTSPPSQNP